MISAENRHIPKTKVTQRYNPFTKSWVKKEQQNPLAGGQVQTEEEVVPDTISPERKRSMQQKLTIAEQQSNADIRPTKDPLSYGMPSENPPAKIPNPRGQSGSSGVYRTQTGRLTLDDMEQILGSVYSEKQACGCSHPCQQPCTCTTKGMKLRTSTEHPLFSCMTKSGETCDDCNKHIRAKEHRLRKSGADCPVTKEEYERAQRFSRDLKESRQKWEEEHRGETVPKEFGLQSLQMHEFAESIARDCYCPAKTDKTLQCRCLVR